MISIINQTEIKTKILPQRSASDRQAQKKVDEEKEKIEEEKKTTSSESFSEDNKNYNSESDTIKNEDFRKYLKSEEIPEFVKRKLIGLYKQNYKPSGDEYIKNNFNGKEAAEEKQKMQEEVEKLKNISNQYDSLKAKNEDLKKEKAELQQQVLKVEDLEKENKMLQGKTTECFLFLNLTFIATLECYI